MREVLIKFRYWSVCKSDEQAHIKKNDPIEIYAEHDACRKNGDNKHIANWSYEWEDKVRNNGYEACWQCEARVPKGVVAIVKLHNWGKKSRKTRE